jgi:hypothetical protein
MPLIVTPLDVDDGIFGQHVVGHVKYLLIPAAEPEQSGFSNLSAPGSMGRVHSVRQASRAEHILRH